MSLFIIYISCSIWKGLYFRFESGIHPREAYEDKLLTIFDQTSSFEDHVKLLRKRVNSLDQLLNINKVRRKNVRTKHKFDKKNRKDSVSENSKENANHEEKVKTKQTIAQLESELKSVAMEWKSPHNIKECACSTTFDAFNRKHQCWSCGEVLCMRCMGVHSALPGHLSKRAVPVCKSCSQNSSSSSLSP